MTAEATAARPRRLYVLRHAKSARPDGVADQDRPLAPRGRRDAPAAGRWLRDTGAAPDLVLCSPAWRTRETWDLAAPELRAGGAAPQVTYDAGVYQATAEELLALVRQIPADVRTLLLIGHNPGLQDLILMLSGEADGDALVRTREKFPTSAIAVLRVPDPWSALAPGAARLTEMAVPRGRKG
ncbi:SixA phosphatase family protein [Streptomyces sp. 8N616]|uniref:SixA phosphatase family protein n=1 Tax=Streptomyces sp. 8N616 TaxID=3457414 RepID=UPI003FD2EB73